MLKVVWFKFFRVHTALNLADIFTKPLGWFCYGFNRFAWILSFIMYSHGTTRRSVPADGGLVPPPGCSADVKPAAATVLSETVTKSG